MSADTDDTGIVRCRVIVSGRVQGVFYRDTCRRLADRLGVSGWVRNRSDGTVEAVIEGDRDDVGELLAWCREGPPRAIVTGVRVIDEPVAGEGPFRVVG
jgi:acylphosphatase